MPPIDPHDKQMFPKFGSAEIDRLRRFGKIRGKIRRYTAGGPLFATGDIAPRMFVLISGSVKASLHDSLRGAGAMTPTPFWAHAMRTDSGRPSSSMRFRTATPTFISVA